MGEGRSELTALEREARIEGLVRQLSEAEAALRELLAGEVDAVVDPVRATPILLRQAQAELRRSDARTALLLQQVPAVVWTTDSDLRVTSIAGRQADVLGAPTEELIGRDVAQAASENTSLAGVLAAHYRALEGQTATFEATLGARVFQGTIEPLHDEFSRIVGCVGLGLDVTRRREIADAFGGKLGTARRKLERLLEPRGDLTASQQTLVEEVVESSFVAVEELQVAAEELHQQNEELVAVHNDLEASRRRFQDLFESAPDGYLVTDPAGIIRRANAAAVRLLGVSEESLRDKPLVVYVAEGDRIEFHRRLDRVRAGEHVAGAEWELHMRSRAGRRDDHPVAGRFPAALTVSPVHDSDGAISGLRWLLRDISETKRAEERERLLREARTAAEEARASNAVLRAVLDTMPAGVVICDAEGEILMTNRPGEQILGSPVRGEIEAPRRTYTPLYPDGSRIAPDEMPLVRAMASGERVEGVEMLIRRDDGSERTILAGAAPVLGPAAQIHGGVTVFQDITARKEMEETIRDLARFPAENPHPVLRVAADGKVAYANEAGQCLLDLWQADVDERVPADWQAYFAEVLARESVRSRDVTCDGREYAFSFAPVQRPGYVNIYGLDITERKRALDEVERLLGENRRQRAFLERLIDVAPVGVAVVRGPDHRYEMVNPTYRAIPASDGVEMVGRTLAQVMPGLAPQASRHLAQVYRTGRTLSLREEAAELGPGREETYWNVDHVPLTGRDGEVDGVLIVAREITEQVLARQALDRYAGRLKVLHDIEQAILAARSPHEIAAATVQRVPELIDCVRADVMSFDLHEGEMTLMASHPAGEAALARGWRGRVDPSFAYALQALGPGAANTIEDLQQTGAHSPWRAALRASGVRALVTLPLRIEAQLVGSLNLGLAEPRQLSSDEHEIARELVTALSIGLHQGRLRQQVERHAERLEETVRRRTAELRAAGARLQAIFDSTAVGIALGDLQGYITEANRGLKQILGYSDEELRGRHFLAFTHPDDREPDSALFDELVRGQRDSYYLSKRYVHKDGSPRWVDLHVSLVEDAEGEPRYSLALTQDVTARREAQQAMIQSEKLSLTGRLAASLAHEINNPLQSVLGCLDLADESLAQGESAEAHQMLRIGAEELERAATIVKQLRDLNRPTDLGNRQLADIRNLMDTVLLLTDKECRNARVQVGWVPGGDLPSLSVAPDQIKQVFLNLILNSVEAMHGGGKLTIRASATTEPAGALVTLTDTGSGIPPEMLAKLYEPFFTTKEYGLGVGLYVTKNIVDAHGGQIEVETAVGEGTTFSVWLPAASTQSGEGGADAK